MHPKIVPIGIKDVMIELNKSLSGMTTLLLYKYWLWIIPVSVLKYEYPYPRLKLPIQIVRT